MRTALGIALIALSAPASGADEKSPAWEALLKKQAPLIVTTPATGQAAKSNPFDPESFGKVRGFSSASTITGSCVVVYTTKLDEKCLALLRKLDAVAGEAKAEGSFVHVFDAKGAQIGGYTAEEISARIKELEVVAKDNKLTRVSLGIAASTKAAGQVGLDDKHDVAVAVLKKSIERRGGVIVQWYHVADTKKLDEKTVEAVANAVQAELKK